MAKQKRPPARKFTDEQKLRILEDYNRLGYTKALAKHRVNSAVIHNWRKKFGMSPPARGKGETVGESTPASPRSIPKDVYIYLKHAKREIHKQAAKGVNISRVGLLCLLALDALEGEE